MEKIEYGMAKLYPEESKCETSVYVPTLGVCHYGRNQIESQGREEGWKSAGWSIKGNKELTLTLLLTFLNQGKVSPNAPRLGWECFSIEKSSDEKDCWVAFLKREFIET